MSERAPETGTSRRPRRLLLAIGALLVLAAVAVAVVTTAGHSSTTGPRASAPAPASTPPAAGTGTPTGGPAPTGAPSGGTVAVDVNQEPPSLAPVPLTSSTATGDGVSGSLVSVEAIQGTASGPGNVAGPALRVSVRLTNGRTAGAPLDGVAVNLAYRADATPASPLDDPSSSPFSGTLEPGASRVGVYVFTVPADQRQVVTVSVGWRAGAPVMVFTGSAS